MVLALVIAPVLWQLDSWLRRSVGRPLQELLMECSASAVLWMGLAFACRNQLLSTELRSLIGIAWSHLAPKLAFLAGRGVP